MKRSILLLTVTAVLMATLMLILTIVSAGAVPVLETAADPFVRVNYDHNWVEGDYPAGHEMTITLKDADGDTKATAMVQSVANGGWDGDGYHAEHDDWWPVGPDIMVGDIVLVTSDDAYENEVKVGQINGDISLVNNGVSGTILVPWFSGQMPIECHPWGAPGNVPGMESSAAADGSTTYECNWNPVDWDIQAGQDIAVMYREPDNDRVIAVFRDPAPDMNVNKWPSGGSQEVAPGEPAIFTIQYHNEGDAPAAPAVFTDTLPAGMSYVADSSGVIPTINGSELIWELGPIAAFSGEEFYVVLEHTGTVSDTLTNMVDVFAENDWQDHNNHAEAEVHVSEGQPDLYVDKHRRGDNPVPGGTVLYEINYGNNGPVPSGHTTLTDTLPANTTVVDWYSRDGYDLWQVVAVNGQLVIEAPAVPANWGDGIMLRLQVDSGVPVDTELVNEVEIYTANDSDPNNNMSTNYANVGGPNWDLHGRKEPRWGSLVPGGYVQYRVEISNDGNMPVQAKLVDTLPQGTSYLHTDDYEDPVIENGTLVWDMGEMLPGEWVDIHFRLAIEDTVLPETVLTNCAEAIMVGHDDDNPQNNIQCVQDMVHETGPNFAVFKESWWQGENREQIQYTIWAGNTGTTQLQNMVVTDTYPEGTTFNGNWWSWWGEVSMNHNPATREIEWTLPDIGPGDFLHIYFTVDLDANLVGKQGLAYLNLVEAPLTGDVYPADNQYEETTYSGADMYVKKWLSDGKPSPGETVIFTVEFGIADSGWDTDQVWLEDLMPKGLLFIKATSPWNPDETWNPNTVSGRTYAWEWGHLWSGAKMQFEIEAVVEDDVPLGSILTNTIEIYSDNPDEIDPLPENNIDTADVKLPILYFPIIVGSSS